MLQIETGNTSKFTLEAFYKYVYEGKNNLTTEFEWIVN